MSEHHAELRKDLEEIDSNETITFLTHASDEQIKDIAERDGWTQEDLDRTLSRRAMLHSAIFGETDA